MDHISCNFLPNWTCPPTLIVFIAYLCPLSFSLLFYLFRFALTNFYLFLWFLSPTLLLVFLLVYYHFQFLLFSFILLVYSPFFSLLYTSALLLYFIITVPCLQCKWSKLPDCLSQGWKKYERIKSKKRHLLALNFCSLLP